MGVWWRIMAQRPYQVLQKSVSLYEEFKSEEFHARTKHCGINKISFFPRRTKVD
jgi:hypothetical protein